MTTLRLIAIAALIAAAAYLAGMVAGGAGARADMRVAQAEANAKAAAAGYALGQRMAALASEQAGAALRTQQEAANARRDLERHRAPPPPGFVGGDARIDPALARIAVCRIERLRAVSPSPACANAATAAGGEPAPPVR